MDLGALFRVGGSETGSRRPGQKCQLGCSKLAITSLGNPWGPPGNLKEPLPPEPHPNESGLNWSAGGGGGPGITDSNVQLGLSCPEGSSRVLGAQLSDPYQFTHGLPVDASPGCQAVLGWSTQSVLGSVLGRVQGARVHNRKPNPPPEGAHRQGATTTHIHGTPAPPTPRGSESWFRSRLWTSLVVHWLKTCLPTEGTGVQSLVQEDSICLVAIKPVYHNYWAHTLEPESHNHWSPTT